MGSEVQPSGFRIPNPGPFPPLPGSSELAQEISRLAREVRQLREGLDDGFEQIRSLLNLATKSDLENSVSKIMSAISDFGAVQAAFNTRLSTAIDGLTQDVQTLNDLITKLQNTAGTVTPEDQAILNDLTAVSAAAVAKAEALDQLTPPPAVPAPPQPQARARHQ